jgi:hypothetical protein
MNTGSLEQQIVNEDPAAPDTARALGIYASPLLKRLLKDARIETRQGAIRCAAQIPEPDRSTLLLSGLDDDDINVRDDALQALKFAIRPDAIRLLLRYIDDPDDDYLRGEVALLAGRHTEPTTLNQLAKRLRKETNSDVRFKITLAMARLENGDARRTLRDALTAPDLDDRYDAIIGYEYVGDTQLLVDLVPYLDDTADVLNTMPAHTQPRFIRICDVVVNTVVSMLSPALSFNGSERRQFTPDELDQIRSLLARKP